MPDGPTIHLPGLELFQAVQARTNVRPKRLELARNAILHDCDMPAISVFYIERGDIRGFQPGPDGSLRLLEILGPGEWMGASAIAGLSTYCKRAVAFLPSTVLEYPVERFLTAVLEDRTLCEKVVRGTCRKLCEAREEAARLVFEDCNQRLVKTLLRFSRTVAARPGEQGVILRITHEQLAQAVGPPAKPSAWRCRN